MSLLNFWWSNKKFTKEQQLKAVVLKINPKLITDYKEIVNIIKGKPEYDGELPEYLGKSLGELLKVFPEGSTESLYENRAFPIYLTVQDEKGTKLFFFDADVNHCTEAVYFNNID